ncbi:hypothetical protein D3C80_1411250 [compost metagenome]
MQRIDDDVVRVQVVVDDLGAQRRLARQGMLLEVVEEAFGQCTLFGSVDMHKQTAQARGVLHVPQQLVTRGGMVEIGQRKVQACQRIAEVFTQGSVALGDAVQRQSVDEGKQPREHVLAVHLDVDLVAAVLCGIDPLHWQIRVVALYLQQCLVLEVHHLRVFQRMRELEQAGGAICPGDLEVQVALAGQFLGRSVEGEAA